jgi:ketosteroid isomerase-like protein
MSSFATGLPSSAADTGRSAGGLADAPASDFADADASAPASRCSTRVSTTSEWVEAFTEGWREPRGAEAFIEHFRDILSEDIRLIQPRLPVVSGKRGFEEQFVRPLFRLMPDLRADVEHWAVNGEEALIEITLRGTLGGREVAWRACDRITVRDGLAVERETYFDPAPLLKAIVRAPRAWPAFIRLQIQARIGARTATRRAT